MKDEIIEELWAVKDQIAEKHGYDVDTLIAHLRAGPDEPSLQATETKNLGPTVEPSAWDRR